MCILITCGASVSLKWHFTASLMAVLSSSKVSASEKIEYPKALASYPPSIDSSTRKMISLSTCTFFILYIISNLCTKSRSNFSIRPVIRHADWRTGFTRRLIWRIIDTADFHHYNSIVTAQADRCVFVFPLTNRTILTIMKLKRRQGWHKCNKTVARC